MHAVQILTCRSACRTRVRPGFDHHRKRDNKPVAGCRARVPPAGGAVRTTGRHPASRSASAGSRGTSSSLRRGGTRSVLCRPITIPTCTTSSSASRRSSPSLSSQAGRCPPPPAATPPGMPRRRSDRASRPPQVACDHARRRDRPASDSGNREDACRAAWPVNGDPLSHVRRDPAKA